MKFSYYYHPESCFLGKIFKNQMRKLLALKAFLIFENLFELFDFSVMEEGRAGFMPASRRRSCASGRKHIEG